METDHFRVQSDLYWDFFQVGATNQSTFNTTCTCLVQQQQQQEQQQPLMYSCTYMKKLQQRVKLNEVRVLAAWNNHRG